MRLALILLLATGCEAGTGAPPDTSPRAYLVLQPATEEKGWGAIEAMRARLPLEERKRIRSAGLVSTEERTMYVECDGTCSAGFVRAARRIAEQEGTPKLSCLATLPGAL